MTVNNQSSEVTYTGDGSQVDFPITFAFIDPVQVLWTPAGGSVIEDGADNWIVRMDSPPADGSEVRIYRDTPITQETEYRPYDAFPAESTENALDKLTEISQELENNKADKADVYSDYVKREGDTMKDANTGIDMNGGIVTGLPNPVGNTDAVNRGYYYAHLTEGPVGPPGSAATVDAGSTTTGDAGTDAEVVNSGTDTAAIFDFTIPRGDKGEKGDKGAPGSGGFDPSLDETVTGSWSMTNPTNVFYGDGSNLTNIPDPDLGLYATKVYSNDGDSSTLKSAKDYTDAEIANIPAPPAGVQLTNTASWTHAQFNQLFIPQKSGSGATSRLTWDPEMYPVVSLSMSSEPLYMTAPFPPTTDGTFIAITWVASRVGQVWTLDQTKFGDDVVAPENNGKDVTRIFWGKFSKWYDV